MQKKIKLKEGSFEYAVYQKLSPAVKSFLSDYFGERLLHLEPEAYLAIERTIEEAIYYHACGIPDILYNHRTIKDSDEWENALENFVKPNTDIQWPTTRHSFDRDYNTMTDEDTYLEDTHDFDLTHTERQAKKVVDAADELINYAQNFALYMRAGYQALNPIARQSMEDNAIFDLTILSNDGFVALHASMDMLIEIVLENLLPIFEE